MWTELLYIQKEKMVLNSIQQATKIRAPVISFAIFAMFVLFQPAGIGTLVGAIILGFTLVLCFTSGEVSLLNFRLKQTSIFLLFFLFIVSVDTWIKLGSVGGYTRFASQIILCVVVGNIVITKKESELIRKFFLAANAAYAVLVIFECYRTFPTRFFHGDIQLLGAVLDPNYIGIPLVTASALALDSGLKSNKKIIYIMIYVACIFAIMFTGSRGNFLGLAISNVLIVYEYMRNKDVKLHQRIMLFIVLAVGLYFLFSLVSMLFSTQWARMSSINASEDNGRYMLWEVSLNAWKTNPILGNGFRSMSVNNRMVSHNTYLQLLSETGVFGSLLFLGFLIPTILKAFICDRTLGAVAFAMLIQIAFLDALDNRAVWVVLIWLTLLPKKFDSPERMQLREHFPGQNRGGSYDVI